MQMNIYVPKEKASLLAALDRAAKRTGRSKNEIVLEAIEKYVPEITPQLALFKMGKVGPLHRADIYEGRVSR